MRFSAQLTLALLAAIFAVNIYRAATQGIIIDEAFTYQHFVAPPLAQVMTTYDLNHHILNSLLAKVTTGLFGVSELTLRIPSLFGGLIYLLAARAIVLYVFSAEWALAAFALLSLNPFVLDYLSAARGYGLALGFLVSALWFLLRRKWYSAGICLGLTIGSNLSFLYPIAGLLTMAALVDTTKKSFGSFLERVVVPLVVLPFVLYVVPISHADPQQFVYGSPTLLDAFHEFITTTFFRKTWKPEWVVPSTEILGALVLVAGAVACVSILRNKWDTPVDRLILLNGGGMLVCLAVTWLAHVTINTGYPFTRTGVYWPVMLTLGGVALTDRFTGIRILCWPAWALAALYLAGFVYEFEVGYYQEWRYDAASKRIAQLILAKGGRGTVRIACTDWLRHSLLFYRNQYHANWDVIGDPKATGDFYVFDPRDIRANLKLVYQDEDSEAVVMQNEDSGMSVK